MWVMVAHVEHHERVFVVASVHEKRKGVKGHL